MHPIRKLPVAALGMVAAAGLIALALMLPNAKTTPTLHGGGGPIRSMRTVALRTTGTPDISTPGAPLQTFLVEGTAPAAPTEATVLTDENCTPDAQGVSHCINRMRLEGGGMISVVHPHRMAEVPCLSPGERVMLRPTA